MKILFIGDVFGKPGRNIIEKVLPNLAREKKYDLIIANAENAAHGKGTRKKDAEFFYEQGIKVLTGGNHSFDQKEIIELMKENPHVLRPANFVKDVAGNGYTIINNVLVINLQGRVFMPEGLDSPFQKVDEILEAHANQNFDAIFVDFHGETTSEKAALFHYLNGRVSAVVGTHTHIQTADENVSEKGTAFITDVGMTGPEDSIIGMDTDAVLRKFLTGLPSKFSPAKGSAVFSAIEIDIENGKAVNIERIRIREKNL